MNNQLIKYSRTNNLSEAKKILATGVDVNFKDEFGDTALLHAVRNDNFDLTELLLKNDADCTIKYEKKGYTVLHAAVSNNQLELAELIIKYTHDVNIKDNYGNNALWTAIFEAISDKNYLVVIEAMLKKGADPFSKNYLGDILIGKKKQPMGVSMSPYDAAVQDNQLDVIELIQKYYPDNP